MLISIKDVLEMFTDEENQYFEVYDLNENEKIFEGIEYECPDKLLYAEVLSIETLWGNNELCFNIEL